MAAKLTMITKVKPSSSRDRNRTSTLFTLALLALLMANFPDDERSAAAAGDDSGSNGARRVRSCCNRAVRQVSSHRGGLGGCELRLRTVK